MLLKEVFGCGKVYDLTPLSVQVFRLSQQCIRGLCSSGVWDCHWLIGACLFRQHSYVIFKSQWPVNHWTFDS